MVSVIRTALAVAAVLACVGCSDSSPSSSGTDASSAATSAASSPTPSSTPAVAGEIEGTGYSYDVPEGWGEPKTKVPGFDPDSFAVDLGDRDGFTDNVNVILSPAGELSADQIEASAESELSGAGFRDFTLEERVDVAGSESAHVTATGSVNDADYRVEQFYPTTDGQTYVVSFSFSTSVSAADRAAVADTVLSSWTWTA